MTNSTELLDGVQLTELHKGSILDIETKTALARPDGGNHYGATALEGACRRP